MKTNRYISPVTDIVRTSPVTRLLIGSVPNLTTQGNTSDLGGVPYGD